MRPTTLTLAALAVAGIGAATAAALPAAGGTTITLVSRFEPATLVTDDVAPLGKRPTVGDRYVYSTALTRGGRRAGRSESVDTAIDGKIQGVLRTTVLLLPDGTVTATGATGNAPANGWKPEKVTRLAVTGGTGAYDGATGTLTQVDIDDTHQRLTLHLR